MNDIPNEGREHHSPAPSPHNDPLTLSNTKFRCIRRNKAATEEEALQGQHTDGTQPNAACMGTVESSSCTAPVPHHQGNPTRGGEYDPNPLLPTAIQWTAVTEPILATNDLCLSKVKHPCDETIITPINMRFSDPLTLPTDPLISRNMGQLNSLRDHDGNSTPIEIQKTTTAVTNTGPQSSMTSDTLKKNADNIYQGSHGMVASGVPRDQDGTSASIGIQGTQGATTVYTTTVNPSMTAATLKRNKTMIYIPIRIEWWPQVTHAIMKSYKPNSWTMQHQIRNNEILAV